MIIRNRVLCVLCVFLISPARATEQVVPSKASDEITSSKSRFQAAAEYSARHGGGAVLVVEGGQIVFEQYDAGCDAGTAFHIHSSTKAFWGPVIAAMIEDGMVSSWDELAMQAIPEWQRDARKRTITLRHLLELNAGVAQDIRNLQGHDRATLAPDLFAHAIQLPVVAEPGKRFIYGPSCYYVLGEIMKRKLAAKAQSPLDYLRERILTPIGVEIGKWVHDDSGNPHIPNGASLTARHWSRFGQFLLQQGTWESKPIIAKELMRELRKPSTANPGHGLAIWLNQPGGFDPQSQRAGTLPENRGGGFIFPEAEPDLFAAMGAGKNRMFMIPHHALVVVRQTTRESDTFRDSEFLQLILDRENSLASDLSPPTSTNASRLQQLFKEFDTNHDGTITADEAGSQPFFMLADTDKNGILSAEEIRQFGRNRTTSPSK